MACARSMRATRAPRPARPARAAQTNRDRGQTVKPEREVVVPPFAFRRSVGLCIFSRTQGNKVFAARRRDDRSGSWQLPQVRWLVRSASIFDIRYLTFDTPTCHRSLAPRHIHHVYRPNDDIDNDRAGRHRPAGEPADGRASGAGGGDGHTEGARARGDVSGRVARLRAPDVQPGGRVQGPDPEVGAAGVSGRRRGRRPVPPGRGREGV
mmetsp:Transcript_8255/g.22369  ORF Transcript_8255/g.22369 Transcript_8255/m.22369 type:complete len:209 (-) Transcript_8255:201-827(-)